jgi:hypothetical protein
MSFLTSLTTFLNKLHTYLPSYLNHFYTFLPFLTAFLNNEACSQKGTVVYFPSVYAPRLLGRASWDGCFFFFWLVIYQTGGSACVFFVRGNYYMYIYLD